MTATASSLHEFVRNVAEQLDREDHHPMRHDQLWTGVARMRAAADAGDAAEVARLARLMDELRADEKELLA